MKGDPLLRYFYKLRSNILKEGALPTGFSMHIRCFDFPRDLKRLGPPPPGAGAFFMGDQSGGSGWEIPLGDGQVEKFYIDIPTDIAIFELHLPNAPQEHQGKTIPDTKIETLAQLYLDL